MVIGAISIVVPIFFFAKIASTTAIGLTVSMSFPYLSTATGIYPISQASSISS